MYGVFSAPKVKKLLSRVLATSWTDLPTQGLNPVSYCRADRDLYREQN